MKTLILIFLTTLISSSLYALPKFSARTGMKCQSCHVNPTGKGMRNTFGATYGKEELPISLNEKEENVEEEITEKVGSLFSTFSLGADIRTLFFYTIADKKSSFFQMQGDIYIDMKLNKKISLHLDKGLYSGFEVYGLAKVLPLHGYVKLGKFLPAYGTRIEDHTAFIRGGGYGSPSTGFRFGQRSEDTGLEFGFLPSIFTFNVGVFNGTPGGGISGVAGEKSKAFVARGDATIQTDFGNLIIGGSFYNHPNTNTSGKTQFYGAFGSFNILQSLTYTGELDYVTLFSEGKEIVGFVTFNELSYTITQGIDANVRYEFYDPDKNLKTGSYTRMTFGVELFPWNGVEIQPMYRLNKEEKNEIKNDEIQCMFHFYL